MARRNEQVQAVDIPDIGDIGALAVKTATGVVKNRPVTVSVWVFGLLLAAFAKGFSVSPEKLEQYDLSLQAAQQVENQELNRALREMQTAENRYYNSKGWFSCDARCQQNLDKYSMTKDAVDRVTKKRDSMLTEARSEVGIWSTFGVNDVRAAFWRAWQSGKDWAARMTMYDALFMAFDSSSREQTLVSVALKMLFQYIVNLTMGLVGMIFFFAYNVYSLIVSYGESALSGLAFFLLVLVAGVATVGTYLFAIYGTVVGGGVYLLKQAQAQAAVEGGRPGGRPRQVQYGGGQYGGGHYGGRAHYD